MLALIDMLKKEIAEAKENGCGWSVGSAGHAIIDTWYSNNPDKSFNGGDYSFWTRVKSTGDGVLIHRQWSADFNYSDWRGNEFDFYPVLLSQASVNALVRKLWNES